MKKRSLLSIIVVSATASTSGAFSPEPPLSCAPYVGRSRGRVGEASVPTSVSLGAFGPIDVSTTVSYIDNFYRSMPMQSAFLTCGLKGSVADALAQRINGCCNESVEGDKTGLNQFSIERNLAYVIYGGLYTGIAQHVLLNELFPLVFGTDQSLNTGIVEVLANNFVIGPLISLPVMYLTKAIVCNYSLEEGMKKYIDDVQHNGLLAKYWALWVPVQGITFGVVPEHLRVLFMASVSFFWFIILSLVSEGEESQSELSSRSTAVPLAMIVSAEDRIRSAYEYR